MTLHATAAARGGETLQATHPRAIGRGARIVDEGHWDGLPTGVGRRITSGDGRLPRPRRHDASGSQAGPPAALLNRAAVTQVEAGRRPLSVYETAARAGLPSGAPRSGVPFRAPPTPRNCPGPGASSGDQRRPGTL